MTADENSTLENQLIEQLSEIDRKINELNAEKSAVQRILSKVRYNKIKKEDVTRSNSFDRIVVENLIKRIMMENNNKMYINDIYNNSIQYIGKIKYATFRSYINRMKEKGDLRKSSTRGLWILNNPES